MGELKYYTYELKNRRKVVYIGITNDPQKMENELQAEGKKFTHLKIIGNRTTEKKAKEWREEWLKSYRENHEGKNPKYNKKIKD